MQDRHTHRPQQRRDRAPDPVQRDPRQPGGPHLPIELVGVPLRPIRPAQPVDPGGNVSTGASRTEQMLRDLNGDGYPEHLLSTSDDQLTVAQNLTNRTNLLASVTRRSVPG
jgi:hypothetical protein